MRPVSSALPMGMISANQIINFFPKILMIAAFWFTECDEVFDSIRSRDLVVVDFE